MGSTLEFMENFPRVHDWLYDNTRDYGARATHPRWRDLFIIDG